MWNHYRDEPNNPPINDDDPPTANHNADPVTNSDSVKYKSSITGKTSNVNKKNGEKTEQRDMKTKKNLEVVVPLKHLSNFWRTLDMSLINCEVSLTLTLSENCVFSDNIIQAARNVNPNADLPIEARERIDAPTFKITDTKLCVPVVTLSTEDDNNFWEQLKSEFKKTIKWN